MLSWLEQGYTIYKTPNLDSIDSPGLRRIDDHAQGT